MDIRLLPTGVPGLDEIFGGGVPEFSFNLIAGLPGCGKTILSHQMMFAMASDAHPALYLTVLGELPLKMLRYQQRFEFFEPGRIGHDIHFVNLSDESAGGDLDRVLDVVAAQMQAHNPALVFLDSIRAALLPALMPRTDSGQRFMQRLSMLMVSCQATTFLLGEYAEGETNPASAIADGMIWLRQTVQRNSMVRKIEVMKMRGQAILPGLHTFRISSSGIKIFSPAPISGGAGTLTPIAPDRSRLLMGVPRLDAMMGGGLPHGYSLLVAGPSGAGKTILGRSFLVEGARRGETGVIAVFEQNPFGSRNRVVADLVDSGRIGLIDSRSPDLSIDEIVMQILDEVARLGATRVVIDSLSAFELTIAPTFRPDFRESLARMVSALARTGVTVLMTTELEDRYTDLRFSPYGTAFLTDAIIVMRYIELDSRLQRLIAVVKVRASAHSDEFRLYTIGPDGIEIGEMLPNQVGLLGGRPTTRLRSLKLAPLRRLPSANWISRK